MILSPYLTTATLPASEMCLFTTIRRWTTTETLSLLSRSNESKGKTANH